MIMRFNENGVFIPNQLINKTREGRVVFFCGAGVSRAFAKLPDFQELTRLIFKNHVRNKDSRANQIFSSTEGYKSLDEIYEELSFEYDEKDITEFIGAELKK